jgi:hypothetical protein
VIPSNSNNRCKAAIPRERTCRRSITFFEASKQSRRIAASFSPKRGDCTLAFARTPPSFSTQDVCIPTPAWRFRRFDPSAASPAPAYGIYPFRPKENQSSSPEEAERVRDVVQEILGSGATWFDKDKVERPIALSDILIIAPYNAQVFELRERLPGARIGTVDKFQGQESAHCDLFADGLELRRCAPRHGVSVFAQPAECRDVAGKVPLHPGRLAVDI